jgi:hypothetical protein
MADMQGEAKSMGKRFWFLCFLGGFLFNILFKLYSHTPWNVTDIALRVIASLVLGFILGTAFKRIYQIDHGIPPDYED